MTEKQGALYFTVSIDLSIIKIDAVYEQYVARDFSHHATVTMDSDNI
jgi:hypothetical protein